jgi:hypothetical protein
MWEEEDHAQGGLAWSTTQPVMDMLEVCDILLGQYKLSYIQLMHIIIQYNCYYLVCFPKC